jgi:AcrR family transcriptional regulator
MAVSRAPRPNPRESAREAFRASLLDAAEVVFTESGFQSTKMIDIAQHAGVPDGTLYHSCDSKEVIFNALLTAREGRFDLALAPALEVADPLTRLTALVRLSFEYLDENAALFAIFIERGGIAEFDIERIGGVDAEQGYVRFLHRLEDALQAAVKKGELRADLSISTMVSVLSGAMNGVLYAWLKGGRTSRLVDRSHELMTLFLSGARPS